MSEVSLNQVSQEELMRLTGMANELGVVVLRTSYLVYVCGIPH